VSCAAGRGSKRARKRGAPRGQRGFGCAGSAPGPGALSAERFTANQRKRVCVRTAVLA